jgi:putative endonuclease
VTNVRETTNRNAVRTKGKPYLSGPDAEQLACNYLLKQGLRLLDQNYRTKRGEIDLIMQDGGALVFVEVRFRKTDRFGSAEESITKQKCQRLQAAAKVYLQLQGSGKTESVRFDAVALSPDANKQGGIAINWVQNILI